MFFVGVFAEIVSIEVVGGKVVAVTSWILLVNQGFPVVVLLQSK